MTQERVAQERVAQERATQERATKNRVMRKRFLWAAVLMVGVGYLAVTFSAALTGGIGVGDALPPVELAALDGSARSLDEWRGRPLVLRFSSATCTFCSRDFELLGRLQAELGDRAWVVAVQVADAPAGVRGALMGASPEIPVVIDPGAELARALGVRSLPAVAFVTARGTLSSLVNSEIAEVDVGRHLSTALLGGPGFQDDVRRAARQLRCRECEGRSVWESDARSSIEIRGEIERRLLAGERPEEIVEAFRATYGDWILMAPPAEGIAALAWVLPAGGIAFGAMAWLLFLRRRAAKREEPAGAAAGDEPGEALARRIKEYM